MLKKFMENMSQLVNRRFPHCTPVGVCNEKGQGPGGQCHKDHCFCELKALS